MGVIYICTNFQYVEFARYAIKQQSSILSGVGVDKTRKLRTILIDTLIIWLHITCLQYRITFL